MNTQWQFISGLLAILGPAVILIYDYAVWYCIGREATISFVVGSWCELFHELPYLAASLFVFLFLHLFGRHMPGLA